MKLWLLKPGYVYSQHDADKHYIGEQQLCHLYGVSRDECYVANDAGRVHGVASEIQEALCPLVPQFSGNYRLPVPYEEQHFRMEVALAAKDKREREAKWVGIPVKDGAGNVVGRVIEAKLCYHPDRAEVVCEVEPSFARYLTSSMRGKISVGD